MNEYVNSMKSALETYQTKRQNAKDALFEIERLYGSEGARKEQERQAPQLKTARTAAENAIREAYTKGLAKAKEWGKLDGGRLTDDVKLLDAELVDADAFEAMKEAYKENSTMLTALKKYGERQNMIAAQERAKAGELPGADLFNTRDIVTGADRIKEWENLNKTAMDMLDALDGTGAYSDSWNKSLGAALAEETISRFGEGSVV